MLRKKNLNTENFSSYKASYNLLKNKTILVTGAGSGIGKSAAIAYAKHGAQVLLLGRTESKLESVYDQINREGYTTPIILPMDLTSADEGLYQDLQKTLEGNLSCLDGLLLNAGVLGPLSPLENISFNDWSTVIQVNTHSCFLMVKACLPLMKSSTNSSILFTSSSVGRKARAYWGPYAVSKFAVEGMMQLLADELVNISSVRVNSLNPKATDTAMRHAAYPGEDPSTNPSPDEIMPAYLYLMGNDSIGITGRSLDAR